MSDVIIIYDSKTGNTEKAAAHVLEGVRSAGASGEMKKVDQAKPGDIAQARGIIFGSYCMRDGCSEKIEVFLRALAPAELKDKPGAAFGSYKFSGGQVRRLEAEMARLGIKLTTAGVNAVKEPDESTALMLLELGKSVAEAIKR
jgi:flavorubredoxin